jgi:hypothetical protein
MKFVHLLLVALCLGAGPIAAQTNAAGESESARNACIQGRRHICGRVLEVSKAGMVIDSGYTSLQEAPWNHSWVNKGNATVTRPAALVERTAADSVAVGLVFLTDVPRRPKVNQYDYVNLIGYPCGEYKYVPAPGVTKTLRRFAGGLATAVRLTQEAKP